MKREEKKCRKAKKWDDEDDLHPFIRDDDADDENGKNKENRCQSIWGLDLMNTIFFFFHWSIHPNTVNHSSCLCIILIVGGKKMEKPPTEWKSDDPLQFEWQDSVKTEFISFSTFSLFLPSFHLHHSSFSLSSTKDEERHKGWCKRWSKVIFNACPTLQFLLFFLSYSLAYYSCQIVKTKRWNFRWETGIISQSVRHDRRHFTCRCRRFPFTQVEWKRERHEKWHFFIPRNIQTKPLEGRIQIPMKSIFPGF